MGNHVITPSDLSRIQEVISPLLGQQAWDVSLGYGAFLTAEFGAPHEETLRTRRGPRQYRHGDWHLWVYGAVWRLEEAGRVIAGCEDDREALATTVRRLNGLALQRVDIDALALDTVFIFDGNITL